MQKLLDATTSKSSGLCVGIDPDMFRLPRVFQSKKDPLTAFSCAVMEALTFLVPAVKLNFAFYESLGVAGTTALKYVLDQAKKHFFVIADGKRSDISNTARFYAKSFFDYWGADAVTVPPYMGRDSIDPYLDYQEAVVYMLCLTSNSGSSDFQKQKLETGAFLYELVVEKALQWNKNGNIGLVVGATNPFEVVKIQEKTKGRIPLLIPGIGFQGGKLEELKNQGFDFNVASTLFSQSRNIIYPNGDFENVSSFQKAVESRAEHEKSVLENFKLNC